MTKAKRGDYIVIKTNKSYHDIKLKKHFYEDFIIAKAWRVSDGIVTQYKTPKSDKPFEIHNGFMQVFTLSAGDIQAKACKLYNKAPSAFDSQDAIKQAILSE